MKTKILGLIVFMVALSAFAPENQTAVNLAVEFQQNPLAIDTAKPRFNWEVRSADRGAGQGAYEILVAADKADFLNPKVLVWESGKVSSSENSGIAYAGPALQSRTRYYWKVRTWDLNDKPCAESEIASFQTGIMSQSDLRGQWIWESNKVKPMDYAYFRTEVDLSDDPAEAYALVSAHNHYMLYINGKQVSGYVGPGVSNPYKSKLYVPYSIAPFLHKGKNAIAAIASYKGGTGQDYVNGVPGFLFEAWGTTQDRKGISILSGPDWKVLANTPYDENAPWLSGRKNVAAEFFDSRKEPVGWKESGFNDSSWQNAAVVATGYNIRSQYMPESGVDKVLNPVKESHSLPGGYLFTLPEEISGWGRVIASAPAGTQVTMRYSDRLLFDRAYHGAADEPTNTYLDKYTFSGKGEETWEPLFGFRGFRYIEVTGLKGKLSGDNLKGIFAHTLMKRTATFESSNELLNKIYAISVHTQEMGMLGQIVDCANREQSQWHADADIQSGAVFYNFYDPQIIRKVLLDLKDGQWDDGRLPDFYPASPRDFNYIPEWDLHYVPMLWRTYFYYNDRYILEECWSVVVKQIKYYESLRDQSGLLGKGGKKVWHISDWPGDFAKMDQKGDYLTVENLLYFDTLNKAADIAKLLGKSEEEKQYRAAALELSKAINKSLYDSEAKAYLDCSGSLAHHQAASALALQVGVVPESERKEVMAYVKSKGFGSSIVLTYNLMEMLYDNDEGEFAYKLVNSENFPGWGYMVKKGATSTWEGWTGLVGETFEHPFAAYMARFLISGIVGIKPLAPGFSKIEIRPQPGADLKWAKASMRVVPGKVSASWEKSKDEFKLSVDIPGNVQAKVCIPVLENADLKIYEGQTQVWPAQANADRNIQAIGKDKAYIDFMVGSGHYDFSARR